MKKSFCTIMFFIILTIVIPLKAEVIDELSYVSDKNDIYMYINVETMISFLKKKGVDINEFDNLAADNSENENDKIFNDFGLKLSDIKEVFVAGRVEDFEKKGGILLFITVKEGKGKIPEALKIKPVKIKGMTFYEIEKDEGFLFTRSDKLFIIGPKQYLENYLELKNQKKKVLSDSGKEFIKNSKDKSFYLKLTVSKYLKDQMDKAFQQGAMMARGITENVFLKSLLNLQSIEYGLKISDKTHFFAGIQGKDSTDSERFLMLSHFTIVASSFIASFADIIAARSDDKSIGKVTENSEFISSIQRMLGRMSAKQTGNGVIISFYITEKETDAFIAMINNSIAERKKEKAERKESEKISLITKAILNKETEKAQLLINDKIDINKKDLQGNTILSTAALMGDTKIAAAALEKGAYIELKTNEGMTPLHYAAKGGNTELVVLLIKKGADVNMKNEIDMTSLHFNAQQGNAEVTRHLVAAGADVNAIAMDGAAPVHLACEEGYIDIIRIFSEKNADFTIKDGNSERGVDIASKNGHTAIVEFFKEKYNMVPVPLSEEEIENESEYSDEFSDDQTDGEGGDLTD